MTFLRSALFALDLLRLDGDRRAARLPGQPVRHRCRSAGWAHGWCRAASAPRPHRARHPHRVEGARARRLGAGRGQAPVDVRDDGDAAAARRPAVVLKRELTDIPLFGWVTRRYGVIPVDRAAAPRRCGGCCARPRRRWRKGGRSLIFPEGTRAPVGERRRCSRASPAFTGRSACRSCRWRWTAAGCGRRDASSSGPGTVTSASARPIPPGLKRDEIEARVHAAINALEPEALQPRRLAPELAGRGDDLLGDRLQLGVGEALLARLQRDLDRQRLQPSARSRRRRRRTAARRRSPPCRRRWTARTRASAASVGRHEEGEVARHRLQRRRRIGGRAMAAPPRLAGIASRKISAATTGAVEIERLERSPGGARRSAASTVLAQPQRAPTGRDARRRPPRPSPADCRPARPRRRAAPAPRPWRRTRRSAAPCRAASRARCARPRARRRASAARRRPDSGGRSRTGARRAAPRSTLRCAAASRPGSSDGPHDLHVLADRVGERPGRRRRTARPRLSEMKLQVTASFEPARGGGAAHAALEQLRRGGGRLRDARRRAAAASRATLSKPVDADDFLDQVGRAVDVAAPGRHASPARPRRDTSKPRRSQDRALLVLGRSSTPPRRARSAPDRRRHAARLDRRRRRRGSPSRRPSPPQSSSDQRGRDREPVVEERRIDAALEAAARVAGQAELLAGRARCARDRNRRIRSARRWSPR